MEIETTKLLFRKLSLRERAKREFRFLTGLAIILILFIIWLFCKGLWLWVITLAVLAYLLITYWLDRRLGRQKIN